LTVKKTVGLSIVDAATIPRVPTGHTQEPVYLWAERAADVIQARAKHVT
jgi:choline dehydrogenase-like flavoprotein